MIQLFSQHFMVLDRNGRQRSFSFDELRRDLLCCFRACGVSDAWAAEEVALVIEEQFERGRTDSEAPVREAEVDALVASVLAASGYGDVAAQYRRLRNGEPSGDAVGPFADWDDARLGALLERALSLLPEDREELAGRVRRALVLLGFTEVSDELVRQLGGHLLRNRAPAPDQSGADDPRWLFPPDFWASAWSDAAAELVAGGVLKPHPVSRLIPRARVDLDLARLADAMGGGPLTELGFLPRLRQVCCELGNLLPHMRDRICQEKPDAHHHPAHLIVRGAAPLIRERLVPMRARDAKALLAEIESLIRADLADQVAFDLIVTIR